MAELPKIPTTPKKQSKRPNSSWETMGLIILAVLVFVLIVIRYWNSIPWSAR